MDGFSMIDDNNRDDYEALPGHAVIALRLPMLCPDCDDIHFLPVTASAVPREGGIKALILAIQGQLTRRGWRIPTPVDMKAYMERTREPVEAEVEQAQSVAKARGAVYIPHTPREGGDA